MWEDFATGIMLFIGGVATIGGLLGEPQALLSDSLYPLGGAALVVLGVVKGRPVVQGALKRARDHESESSPAQSEDSIPTLELYQSEGCPYCQKVRKFCTRNGISLIIHNPRTAGTFLTNGQVQNQHRHNELVAHGQDQIPLLVDNVRDEVLYESDDIVAYLDKYYA